MKYEEDVEEGGERWSKPHVASLSLHSLFELRSTILNGALLLDLDAFTIGQVVGKLAICNLPLISHLSNDQIPLEYKVAV